MNRVHDQLTLEDFTTEDVVLKKDTWVEIGTYEVGVTEEIEVGYGVGDAESAVGRVYFNPQDSTPALIDGDMKIEYTDKEGTTLNNRVIQSTVDLYNSGADNFKNRMPLNRTFKVATRERKLRLLMKASADKTLVAANSKLLMSITRISL